MNTFREENTAVDAFSRNINTEINTEKCLFLQELVALDETEISTDKRKDKTWQEIIKYLENRSENQKPKLPAKYKIEESELVNNLLYRTTELKHKDTIREKAKQVIIPETLVSEILLQFIHNSPSSSHPGKEKSYNQPQLKCFWISMRKDIFTHVDNCQICAETKSNTRSPPPMLTYPIPQKPWERIHIDTLELPMSENGYKYLFIAIDYFSRYCVLKPHSKQKSRNKCFNNT